MMMMMTTIAVVQLIVRTTVSMAVVIKKGMNGRVGDDGMQAHGPATTAHSRQRRCNTSKATTTDDTITAAENEG